MTSPTLLSVSNTHDTLNLSGNIVLTFDMPIAAGEGTVRIDLFGSPLFIEDIGVSRYVTISGNTLTINPPQDLAYGSNYQLYLFHGVVTNAQTGEPLKATEHFFTTGASPHPLQLTGTSGDDHLIGSAWDDVLSGGDGRDDLRGGNGNDRLDGGAGNDYINDSGGNNTLLGGDGNDSLSAAGFDESDVNLLDGGMGDDWLDASHGISTQLGGAGDDNLTIWGGSGTLDGGDGNDFIAANRINAVTTAHGGAGSDRFQIAPDLSAPLVISDFATGAGGDVIDPYVQLYFPAMPNVGEVTNVVPPANFLYTTGHVSWRQDGADAVLQVDRDGEAGQVFQLQTIAILRNTQTTALTADNLAYGVTAWQGQRGITLTGSAGADQLTGGIYNDALYGSYGNDKVDGLAGDDFIEGGDGDDRLAGQGGNDALYGGDGNDMLEGGAGNDWIDGDNGMWAQDSGRLDSVYYDTPFAKVRLTHERFSAPEYWTVQDTTGALGTDTLTHVERLIFTDQCWALDVGLFGYAGQVYRLYQAAFDRQPDIAGLSYWLNKVDKGLDTLMVADSFTRSDEFRQVFGATPSNTELVNRLYHNILHREPDAQGKAYWIDVLDKKQVTTAEALFYFSASPENYQNVAKIIGDGFAYEVSPS
ncbi:DUF4214 domain-containing protein [Duganella sp. FT92W]|uniref:DUF4214 domain-containing protein n=1 Tax=Pseudoduganella rivuli TaxID=2666085 RepID=A0A7X2IUA9_9BURK|nr:DUF4214 domain-containing protein [Pseudoduganella rivuli]MRV76085.1 DUF4214 domain-containing protein [Pseudoduganella rivuli]